MLSDQDLKRLAAVGAKARLETLRNEEVALLRAFPDLGRKTPPQPSRARKGMSDPARKAVPERMTRYWAKRRAAKK